MPMLTGLGIPAGDSWTLFTSMVFLQYVCPHGAETESVWSDREVGESPALVEAFTWSAALAPLQHVRGSSMLPPATHLHT